MVILVLGCHNIILILYKCLCQPWSSKAGKKPWDGKQIMTRELGVTPRQACGQVKGTIGNIVRAHSPHGRMGCHFSKYILGICMKIPKTTKTQGHDKWPPSPSPSLVDCWVSLHLSVKNTYFHKSWIQLKFHLNNTPLAKTSVGPGHTSKALVVKTCRKFSSLYMLWQEH